MKSARTAGFTLVELLITMGLLGIILTVLAEVQSSTFKISAQVGGQANRLRALQDVSGYLGDRLRSAKAVSTSLTLNSKACSLTPATGDYPCFAIVAGETRQVGSTVLNEPNTYLYLAYRLIPRSDLAAADKEANTWADTNTLALVEYRSVICEGNCTTASPAPSGSVTIPTAVPASLTLTDVNPMMDYATLDKDTTTTFVPFSYDPATGKFTLDFRQKQQVGGKTSYTPASGPLEVIVQRRN